MARPSYNTIAHGQQSWDADLDDNFDVLENQALLVPEYANFAGLPAAALYDRCLAVTIDTNSLWMSNGTNWLLIPRGGQTNIHSYPWAMIRGGADADSIIHYPNWTLTEDTDAFPALNVDAGEEKDGGTGRRTTFVGFDVDLDDGRETILDLRIALPEGFTSFASDGIRLFHRFSTVTVPGEAGADALTIRLDVYDPTTVGDTTVADTTRSLTPAIVADANYVVIQITGATLNGIANAHQAEDMLHLRITLSGNQAVGTLSYTCRLGKLELNMS